VVVGENVADSISDFARRERADLIGIATHGRAGLARFLRGSVADALTKSAASSILVFHPERALAKGRPSESDESAREEEVALA
jgi:nucleotide-binding universal stress UspA family protein